MRLFLLIIGFVSLIPLAATAQSEPMFSGVETRLTTAVGDQVDPAISGNLIVYSDNRLFADYNIFYYDILTNEERPVTTALSDQLLSGVSNGKIVYTDFYTADVMLFDTITGSTYNLTGLADSNSIDPAIDQNLVVWIDDRDGNLEIYGRNLLTGEERRLTNSLDLDREPSVNGDWIVWQSCDVINVCDIFAYNWLTLETRQITNTVGDEKGPDVGEHIVVYQGDRNGQNDIYAYDLNTGVERQLDLPGNQLNPNISGDYVAFDDTSNGSHVKLWHLPTNSVFTVTTASGGQYLNDIDGNRIVYTDIRSGQPDIYMTTFNVAFPPAAGTLSNTQLLINKKLKSFFLLSTLTLPAGNNGLNPPNEVVSFKIGNASATIPAGKFRKLTNSLYAYAGTINNVNMEVLIRTLGNNQYTFQTAGAGYNFSGIINPVNVEVSIGNQFATASVNAVIK